MSNEPSVEPPTPSATLAAKDTFRILILDTVEHANQLKQACKDAGHSVVAAKRIEEAFAFLDGKDHADVIVSAAYLQEESVFEFLRRLRADPIHKHSTFMTLSLAPSPTGVKLDELTAQCGRHLGADAFVSMPVFDALLLISEIKKLLPRIPHLEVERLKNASNVDIG